MYQRQAPVEHLVQTLGRACALIWLTRKGRRKMIRFRSLFIWVALEFLVNCFHLLPSAEAAQSHRDARTRNGLARINIGPAGLSTAFLEA